MPTPVKPRNGAPTRTPSRVTASTPQKVSGGKKSQKFRKTSLMEALESLRVSYPAVLKMSSKKHLPIEEGVEETESDAPPVAPTSASPAINSEEISSQKSTAAATVPADSEKSAIPPGPQSPFKAWRSDSKKLALSAHNSSSSVLGSKKPTLSAHNSSSSLLDEAMTELALSLNARTAAARETEMLISESLAELEKDTRPWRSVKLEDGEMYMVSVVHPVEDFCHFLKGFKIAQMKGFSLAHGITAAFVGEAGPEEPLVEEDFDESKHVTAEDKVIALRRREEARSEAGPQFFAHVVLVFEENESAQQALSAYFDFSEEAAAAVSGGGQPLLDVSVSAMDTATSHADPAEAEMMLSFKLPVTCVTAWRDEFEKEGLHKRLGINASFIGENIRLVSDSEDDDDDDEVVAHIIHFYPKEQDEAIRAAVANRIKKNSFSSKSVTLAHSIWQWTRRGMARASQRESTGPVADAGGGSSDSGVEGRQTTRSTLVKGTPLALYKFMAAQR